MHSHSLFMKCSENSLKLNSPSAMLCLQDVSDLGTLQSVEVAMRDNTSLKKMTIQTIHRPGQTKLTWTYVAVAILKGAAKNETLGTLKLGIRDGPFPTQEFVDEVRRLNPRLQLTVEAGPCESEHVTVDACTVYLKGLS